MNTFEEKFLAYRRFIRRVGYGLFCLAMASVMAAMAGGL